MKNSNKNKLKRIKEQVRTTLLVILMLAGLIYWYFNTEVWFRNIIYMHIEGQVSEVTELPNSIEKRDFLLTVKKALADDKLTSWENKKIYSAYKEVLYLNKIATQPATQKLTTAKMEQMLADVE